MDSQRAVLREKEAALSKRICVTSSLTKLLFLYKVFELEQWNFKEIRSDMSTIIAENLRWIACETSELCPIKCKIAICDNLLTHTVCYYIKYINLCTHKSMDKSPLNGPSLG